VLEEEWGCERLMDEFMSATKRSTTETHHGQVLDHVYDPGRDICHLYTVERASERHGVSRRRNAVYMATYRGAADGLIDGTELIMLLKDCVFTVVNKLGIASKSSKMPSGGMGAS
jgi:hypothetical protein